MITAAQTLFDRHTANIETLLPWLRAEDNAELSRLWQAADAVRQANVGDAVHLRGLIEFSNQCIRVCGYCGLRAPNRDVVRYRMTADEIMECVHQAVEFGYGTVVLQSGEDPRITGDWVADLVKRIKRETRLAVTLSLGERTDEELSLWKEAGADRYLLRFETSNQHLYDHIHPPLANPIRPGPSDRFAILRRLRELRYEVGSGVMIGIPGQTYADLARDLLQFRQLDLDMIGVGPCIIHPDTPLADPDFAPRISGEEQVPNTEAMTYKVVALARLMCPRANIPSTTALATLNTQAGRELGLRRGANVVMPNVTPPEYRELYQIYPNKACLSENADACHHCMKWRLEAIGRTLGEGRGDSPNFG